LTLNPYEAQPGGTIYVDVSGPVLDATCDGTATSPGFVAPIHLGFGGHAHHSGAGQVITRGGRYRVTVPCLGGGALTDYFTIIGPPPTIVTPVGPPQTGGGGTAFNS
jgi:hypothetical protein